MTGKIGGSNRSVSMREAAEYIGCAYHTFARHYKDDWKIPHYRVGGRVRFLQRHLDAFIEARTEVLPGARAPVLSNMNGVRKNGNQPSAKTPDRRHERPRSGVIIVATRPLGRKVRACSNASP